MYFFYVVFLVLCSRFTIHGLWPQYYNDTWPQFCTGEGFDPSLVADLEPVLRREWPSVFSDNAAFWKHEWRKHGTCAEGLCPLLSDEHSFFFAVLALNKMYNLNVRGLLPGLLVLPASHNQGSHQANSANQSCGCRLS